MLYICTNGFTVLSLEKNASFAANLYVLSDPLFLSLKNKLLQVFGLFCVTIVISIIVIFCAAFFSGDFFQLPMWQFCQAQKVYLLFVPTHHHQPHCHLLFPHSQNLIKATYQSQVVFNCCIFKSDSLSISQEPWCCWQSLQMQSRVEALISLCGSSSYLKFWGTF